MIPAVEGVLFARAFAVVAVVCKPLLLLVRVVPLLVMTVQICAALEGFGGASTPEAGDQPITITSRPVENVRSEPFQGVMLPECLLLVVLVFRQVSGYRRILACA